MVKEETKNNKTYFMCEACDMYYRTKELAEQCEKYCNEKHACNTELIKHAVQFDEKGDCNC